MYPEPNKESMYAYAVCGELKAKVWSWRELPFEALSKLAGKDPNRGPNQPRHLVEAR